jgi:cell division septation protein DedD
VAGQIATALIGFALGVVVTLLFVIHWASPPAARTNLAVAVRPMQPERPRLAPSPVAQPTPVAPADTLRADASDPVDDEAPTSAAATRAPVERPASSGRYAVQLGVFSHQAAAFALAQRVTAAGFAAGVAVHADEGSPAHYIVRLTKTFADRPAASRTAQDLRAQEHLETLIARVAPSAPSQAQADQAQ